MSDTKPASSTWRDFWYYLPRWILFGILGAALQPVTSEQDFWQFKVMQAVLGIAFGTACALAFTPLQNYFNPHRARLKFWLIAVPTWMLMKFVFAAILWGVS